MRKKILQSTYQIISTKFIEKDNFDDLTYYMKFVHLKIVTNVLVMFVQLYNDEHETNEERLQYTLHKS